MNQQSATKDVGFEDEQVEEEEEEDASVSDWEVGIDMSEAKACVKQFTNVDTLVNHIIENIPPTKRDDDFTLIPINIDNKPDLKAKANPDDKTAGYWNNFVDIDEDQWILRGTQNMSDLIYPICNRGHQHSAMCMAALAFAKLFEISEFKAITVNDILKYGDRMHTCIIKSKLDNLTSLNDPLLTEEEVCVCLNKQRVEPADVMKMFLIGPWKVTTEVTPKVVEGDIHATENDEILNVEKGLEKFFENENFGILHAKQLSVGVFKGNSFFYF